MFLAKLIAAGSMAESEATAALIPAAIAASPGLDQTGVATRLMHTLRDAVKAERIHAALSEMRANGELSGKDYEPAQPFRPRAAPTDLRKSQLTRLAFKILASNPTIRALVNGLRIANAQLPHPLTEAELDDLTIWAAKKHREKPHAG